MISSPKLSTAKEDAVAPSFAVNLRIEIPTEQIRVFQAVTIAEYVEMWVASQDRCDVICESEARAGGKYRLSVSRRGRRVFDVKGEFVVFEPFETIVCSLEDPTLPFSPKSFVTLSLSQGSKVTALNLTHTCLSSVDEEGYFRSVWTACLGRLVKLLTPLRP